MATFGNTIIAYDEMEKYDDPADLLEALDDLRRLAELMILGLAHGHEEDGRDGDRELLHSLLWPMGNITGRLRTLHEQQKAAAAAPKRKRRPKADAPPVASEPAPPPTENVVDLLGALEKRAARMTAGQDA